MRYSSDLREIAADNTDGPQATCVVPAPGVQLTPPGASQCPRIFQHTYSSPSWLASIDHQFTPDILGYFKISHGYRSGGFNYRGSNSIQTFAPFAPETVTEFETGDEKRAVRSSRARQSRRLSRQLHEHPAKRDGTHRQRRARHRHHQRGLRCHRCFEAETVWRATDNFTLNASTSLTDANYIKFVDLTGNRSGEHFDVPKWTVLTGFRYAEPTPWGEAALQGRLPLAKRGSVGAQRAHPVAGHPKCYGVLDARATLDIDRWGVQIALYGKNLTDRNYLASAISLESALGFNYVIPGDPRTYGIELIKRFGGI